MEPRKRFQVFLLLLIVVIFVSSFALFTNNEPSGYELIHSRIKVFDEIRPPTGTSPFFIASLTFEIWNPYFEPITLRYGIPCDNEIQIAASFENTIDYLTTPPCSFRGLKETTYDPGITSGKFNVSFSFLHNLSPFLLNGNYSLTYVLPIKPDNMLSVFILISDHQQISYDEVPRDWGTVQTRWRFLLQHNVIQFEIVGALIAGIITFRKSSN